MSTLKGRAGGSPRSKPSTSCRAAHAGRQLAASCARKRPRWRSGAARRRAWASGWLSGSTASTKFSKFANASVCCLKERERPSPAATAAAWILRGAKERGNVRTPEKRNGVPADALARRDKDGRRLDRLRDASAFGAAVVGRCSRVVGGRHAGQALSELRAEADAQPRAKLALHVLAVAVLAASHFHVHGKLAEVAARAVLLALPGKGCQSARVQPRGRAGAAPSPRERPQPSPSRAPRWPGSALIAGAAAARGSAPPVPPA